MCTAIAENRQKAFKYTIKANTVAVVSDGTAVLGLGDIGPEAAMPVMEGKAMLLGVRGRGRLPDLPGHEGQRRDRRDRLPHRPLRRHQPRGHLLAAVRFEIEQRLKDALDILFHDDQHGTAIVTLAALINACRLTGRTMETLEVLMVGAGAAGVAVSKILMDAGVCSIVACDRFGAIHTGREDYEAGSMNTPKRWLAEHTNPTPGGHTARGDRGRGPVHRPVRPGHHRCPRPRADEPGPVRFAMANPNPEVRPEEAAEVVRVMATGRSDYPNQINNVLAFPGVLRRTRRARARHHRGDEASCGGGIAGVVSDDELDEDYIIPSVFNRDVSSAVAAAVAEVAKRSGAASDILEQPTVERPGSPPAAARAAQALGRAGYRLPRRPMRPSSTSARPNSANSSRPKNTVTTTMIQARREEARRIADRRDDKQDERVGAGQQHQREANVAHASARSVVARVEIDGDRGAAVGEREQKQRVVQRRGEIAHEPRSAPGPAALRAGLGHRLAPLPKGPWSFQVARAGHKSQTITPITLSNSPNARPTFSP